MKSYRVTLACKNYDRTQAVIRGLVKAPGIDLQVVEMTSVPEMFAGMFRGEYDASEMSLAELVYYTSRDQNDFIGIPVFPSRMFRHGFIFYNPSSGIEGPESLEGRKLGFPRLVQTAVVWIRGILADEYHIQPAHTPCYFASVHHWEDSAGSHGVTPRDGSGVLLLEKTDEDVNETLDSALMAGRIDALGSTQAPHAFLEGDERVKRLFPDYKAAEASYFQRTGIFPIMHVLVVRKAALEGRPDLPERLFEIFAQSRRLANEWLRTDPSLGLVWKNQYIEEEERLLGRDPWAYGLGENEGVIEKFLSYCYDQGVSARHMEPRELFAPSTWGLAE
ncbi:MAG: hypothetical protein V3S82_08440 [Dehalococcoidia bacterium]